MIDLAYEAAELHRKLALNRRNGITDDNAELVQALCVAEEAGELVGAYRRHAGLARRTGPIEDVEHEVADVLIVTATLAHMLGIDIDKAVREKLAVIYSRGWKEEESP